MGYTNTGKLKIESPNLLSGGPETGGESAQSVVEQIFCSSPSANPVGVEDTIIFQDDPVCFRCRDMDGCGNL
jgi:hypothetical protein